MRASQNGGPVSLSTLAALTAIIAVPFSIVWAIMAISPAMARLLLFTLISTIVVVSIPTVLSIAVAIGRHLRSAAQILGSATLTEAGKVERLTKRWMRT